MYMYLTTLVILLHPIQGLAILMWLQVQYNISVACGRWSSHLLNYGRKILKNERRKILLLKGMSGEIWMLESSLLKSGDMQLNNKNFIIPYIFLCPSIDEHWTCSSPNTLCIVIGHTEVFRIRAGQLRARTFKCWWGPRIDAKEWIPPAYVVWRAGTKTLFLLGA